MPTRHCPDVSTLMTCSAGSQPEALCAVVASHISMCTECLGRLRKLEKIGLVLFEQLEGADVEATAPDIAGLQINGVAGLRRSSEHLDGDVPCTLAGTIGPRLDGLNWTPVSPGISQYVVQLSPAARGDLRLLKLDPGATLPRHGHKGEELTLVLRGRYSDETADYEVADVADLDDETEHAPKADASIGCILLVASETAPTYLPL